MQAILDSCKESVLRLTLDCVSSEDISSYKPEVIQLSRYVAKVALVLSEIELQIHVNEDLRGSKELFLAAETTLAALSMAEALIHQSATTGKAQIWALEDAAEFQSVTLELLNALSTLSRVREGIPKDIQADILHFMHQFEALDFTTSELEETEELEFLEAQREAKYNGGGHKAAAATAVPAEYAEIVALNVESAAVPISEEWPEDVPEDEEESNVDVNDEELLARTEYSPLADGDPSEIALDSQSREKLPEDPFSQQEDGEEGSAALKVNADTLHKLAELKVSKNGIEA